MSVQNTSPSDDERLVVSPKRAGMMLGYGITRIYELINSGEVESFKDGGARKIVVSSLRDYVARHLRVPAA